MHHNSKCKREGNRSGEAHKSRREREIKRQTTLQVFSSRTGQPAEASSVTVQNQQLKHIFFLHYLFLFFFLQQQYLVYFLISMINFYSIQINHLSCSLSAKDGHLLLHENVHQHIEHRNESSQHLVPYKKLSTFGSRISHKRISGFI